MTLSLRKITQCSRRPRKDAYRKPWISPSQVYLGYHGIGLEVDPHGIPVPVNGVAVTNVKNDNANITLGYVPYSSSMLYWGFALKLEPGHFDVPTQGILLTQMWQGSPYSPPVSLHLTPNDPTFSCEIEIRNNETGGNPSATPITFPIGQCSPGGWQLFRIGVLPHYQGQSGTGQIIIWHNDMSTPVAAWSGDIGYNPNEPVNINGTLGRPQSLTNPDRKFTIYYGPYRGAQSTTAQTFWANIKLGASEAAADPSIP